MRQVIGSPGRSAVIVNSYSYHNAGDAAIMLATAHLLHDLGYDTVALATRYDHESAEYERWGLRTSPPLISFLPRGRGSAARAVSFLIRAVTTVASVAVFTSIFHPAAARRLVSRLLPNTRAIIAADLVIIAGGGYLYSSKRRVNLSLLHSTLTMWLCGRLGRRVVAMPASVGPVHRCIDRALVEAAYRRIRPVLRETESLNASSRRPRIAAWDEVPDIAFYGVPIIEPLSLTHKSTQGGIRIVCMDWSWSSSVGIPNLDNYIARIAQLCTILATRGYSVTLSGHSRVADQAQDDIEVCQRVAQAAQVAVAVDGCADVGHLVEAYARADLVIGTRLHACVLATSVGTPSIALAYQEKAVGAFSGLPIHVPHFWVDTFDPQHVAEQARLMIGIRWDEQASHLKSMIREYYAGCILR